MASRNEVEEIDSLERGLLLPLNGSQEEPEIEAEDETVLYNASFQETEENFVMYQTAQWVLYSLLLILAWGIGLFMLLYIPVRRYILRKDIRSRKLYLTENAIVYKVTGPVPFPCFGVLKKEKHVLLPLVADLVVEQGALEQLEVQVGVPNAGKLNLVPSDVLVVTNCDAYNVAAIQLYLQSLFGVYSLRIKNAGVRRPASDDVRILGVANPSAFRKAVLMRLANMRSEGFARQVSTTKDIANLRQGSPSKSLRNDSFPHFGEQVLLQKLEEVGSSVKRVQSLIEEQRSQTSEPID